MKETTLCYIYRKNEILLLHRVKKNHDENAGKWIGKFEENESPEDCVLREVKEETGLTLLSPRYRGIVTFVSDRWEGEHMHLFTADRFSGTVKEDCDEGVLRWVPREEFAKLPQWEGDKLFLDLLEKDEPFFSLKLTYRGSDLTGAVLNGETLKKENA